MATAKQTTIEPPRPRRLVSIEEVGPYITGEHPDARPLSRASIYRLIATGRLHKVNIGRRSFVTVDSIDAYFANLVGGAL